MASVLVLLLFPLSALAGEPIKGTNFFVVDDQGREAGEEAERRHDEIAAALTAELSRYETPEGIVMESSSWKITARNPE